MKIPAPTSADGFALEQINRHKADLARLEADPRTAGDANRPKWLVDQILNSAK